MSGGRAAAATGSPSLSDGSLPRQLAGFRSTIVWGVALLVVIESTVLALFVVSYWYLSLGATVWPPPGIAAPDLLEPTVGQALLLASPLPVWLGLRGLRRDRRWPLLLGLPVAMAMAGAYLGMKVFEYAGRDYLWSAHAYGSLDWSMSGYAALHVMTLLLAGGVVWALTARKHFGSERYTGVQALVIYWVFVGLGSLLLYGVQYLTPRL